MPTVLYVLQGVGCSNKARTGQSCKGICACCHPGLGRLPENRDPGLTRTSLGPGYSRSTKSGMTVLDAGLLGAGGGLLLAPAAGVPALGHAGSVVGEGRLGREAGQVELVAVGAGLDGGP